MKLRDIILENDFDKYKKEENQLASDINRKFKVDPFVSMGEFAGGREDDDPLKGKGYGSVTFRVRGEFETAEWNEIVTFIKSKGYEVTQESNYYDTEPGERDWFPKVDFHFNVEKS
tara:strand:- start:1818 stop:2165 length:348 start_codon:yes stop_codon:yes gene_type:complete